MKLGKKKKTKKKSNKKSKTKQNTNLDPKVQLSPEELAALESGDDEVLRRYAERRIRANKKRQRKRKQQKIRRRALLVMILCLAGMNAVLGARYVNNLLKAGGTVLDGDVPMVTTARSQLGNYGGDKFWKWYGFDSHVDWCACFVSWCADQNGLIDDGKVPMSCYVPQQVNWFKDRGMYHEQGDGYKPKAGDIIFFDWEHDGSVDHVGIVASVFRGKVYTIEGNSGFTGRDEKKWKGICQRNGYDIDSKDIFGYGLVEKGSGKK